MAMYEVGTIAGAVNQAKVTGSTTKWSQAALGIQEGSILVVYKSGGADLYAIKSVDSDTQLTLSRNITVAFSGASYGIITSETASTSAFANQLASAFSLWRSVIQGWSTALTASGNITLTDPLTGASVTVPAISGMAKTNGGNNLTGVQSITNDDSGLVVGNNADIGIIKKSGTYGKILMGSSTRFCVARSNNGRISPTDSQTELFAVETNGDVKGSNSIFAKQSIQAGYDLRAQSIELTYGTPFIDFHYNNTSNDYSGRVVQDASDQLSVVGSHWRVERDLRVSGIGQFNREVNLNLASDPNPNVGAILQSPWTEVGFHTRGLDPTTPRGRMRTWFEELVGSEHRGVVEVSGFNAGVKYWYFASNGDFRALSGSVMARKQEGGSNTGDWSMGGRMVGVATGMTGPSGNLRFEMYARDHVGDMSSVVVECHTYQGRRDFGVNADGGMFGPLGMVNQNGSDIRLKKDIDPIKDDAEDRIHQLGPVEYTWSESGKRARGFIAQQVDGIDELYTELLPEQQDRDFRILAVNDRAITADLVAVVQNLMNDRDSMKQEIEALKAQISSASNSK